MRARFDRSRRDLEWVPRPSIDIAYPEDRRPKAIPPGGVRVAWPEIAERHRLVRVPKAEAVLYDWPWDELCLANLHKVEQSIAPFISNDVGM